MNEEIKELLKEVDVLKEQASALRKYLFIMP